MPRAPVASNSAPARARAVVGGVASQHLLTASNMELSGNTGLAAPRNTDPVPRPVNNFLVYTGAYTLVQALIQFMACLVAIAQYFCFIDFLRGYATLIYIKILYYHFPNRCGADINLGMNVDELADQAFILLDKTPTTTSRNFIVTCIYLTLSVFWVVASYQLIKGGHRQHHSNHSHWPWVVVLLLTTLVDVTAVIMCINDSFYTQTLRELINFVEGTASGLGNFDTNTAWVAWIMMIVYSRCGVFLIANIILTMFTIIDCTKFRTSVTSSEIGRNVLSSTESPGEQGVKQLDDTSDTPTLSSVSAAVPKIPRPGLSASFREMKDLLFNGRRSRVNFQDEESASDPVQNQSTFENLIAEQQRRLRTVTIDTSGRRSPPLASRSLPQLNSAAVEQARARSTTGQMPWAYIAGAPTNRMRDQLPPDEDLPPVPLPDYTALQSKRKASVHRAASSLSSLNAKDYSKSNPGSTQVDVLY